MTYNHERAKVICPEAAKRVEELEAELHEARGTIEAQSDDLEHMQVVIDNLYDDLSHCDC